MTSLADAGIAVDIVYQDFSEAFSVVSHKILRGTPLMYRLDEQSARTAESREW